MKLLRIGFGNAVVASRVQRIISLEASSGKRWRQEAGRLGRVIDATAGRQTRSMLITDSGHRILSSMSSDALQDRLHSLNLDKE